MIKFKFALFPSVLFLAALGAGSARAQDPGSETRRETYLASLPSDAKGAFGAVARLWKGDPLDLDGIQNDLNHIGLRKDCGDFKMAGFLRLLYLDRDRHELPEAVESEVIAAVFNFKYWIDEPGRDSCCYWSENHQILFHSEEYLAGALFPDQVFSNAGVTGAEHREKGAALVRRWLDWRERFGFSEWLSNVYYEEDIYALLNLVDFAPDPDIAERAAMALDQIALNLALNSFRGGFTCTHGRTYAGNILSPRRDAVRHALYLWWGEPEFGPDLVRVNSAGVAIATSSYRLPPVIFDIGLDRSPELENFQIHGLAAEDAPDHGFSYDDLASGMFFWGQGMYTHHLVVDLSAKMWQEYDLFDNSFFMGLARPGVALSRRGKLDNLFAKFEIASEGAILADNYTYTYRTPDYILSTALDRRAGLIDAQGLIWQAGLGGDAVVFTTFPGRTIGGWTPNAWAGNGSDPRAAQSKNVLVAIYDAPLLVAVGERYRSAYSHAWFPRPAFDEVVEQGHWIFGRKDDGYVALYSHAPAFWRPGPSSDSELMALGRRNVWICELGRRAVSGEFEEFIAAVSGAAIEVVGTRVSYASPSRGRVEFDWTGPFRVDGAEVPLRRELRYDNPFVRAPRFSERIVVRRGGQSLTLDFHAQKRTISH